MTPVAHSDTFSGANENYVQIIFFLLMQLYLNIVSVILHKNIYEFNWFEYIYKIISYIDVSVHRCL